METRDCRLRELKFSADEEGTFAGWLSIYDNVDSYGDIVERGAFTKTINDNGGKVPLLWQHDAKTPVGVLELADQPKGLFVKGRLVLAVQKAREAYELLKSTAVRGLSIGFLPVGDQNKVVDGHRRLRSLRLFEGSIVTFSANPLTLVTNVKADDHRDDLAAWLAGGDKALETHRMNEWLRGA